MVRTRRTAMIHSFIEGTPGIPDFISAQPACSCFSAWAESMERCAESTDLQEISSIRPERGLVGGHNSIASASCKARDKSTAFIAVGDVFAL